MVICGRYGGGVGCLRPALRTLAEARPPGKCKCPSFGARGLGWVRFPALKNVSRQWIHSCCQFTVSRKRQRDIESLGRERKGEGRGARALPLALYLFRTLWALQVTGSYAPRLLAGGNRGSRGERLGGEALVGSIVKRNRESQKMFKTKEGTILQRRRSLIPKLCRQESWLRSVQRVYCVGSQAESGNMKKWGGVESTVEGKSVRRRLRMAGKCHQGECSGTK